MTRHLIVSLVLLGCLQASAAAQTRAAAAPTKACSLLTRELALQASPKQPLDAAGPNEVSLGANGMACEWGALMLSVDPYTPARLEEIRKTSGKQWEVVPGVGDAAYFHNVKDAMAELFVRVGARTFVVIITIPVGSTAAAFKPNFVAVANAVAPKLR